MTATRSNKPDERQSQPLIDSWEALLNALDEKLRASGRTVTVKEPSDTTELPVTFPQGHRPGATKVPGGPKTRAKPRDLPRVSIGVEWGYEVHCVRMPAARWAEIKDGAEFVAESKGWYEGDSFDITWQFNCGRPGSLVVSYGEDGADGFIGSIGDAIVTGTDAT